MARVIGGKYLAYSQLIAIDHNLKWNSIHPSIQAATLVHNSRTSGSFCTLCHEADYLAKSCAMSFFANSA